ncbi:ATP-binding protein [Rhizobium viscosum]
MSFRQLHVDQASLQRDVLQIRAGLLDNYDSLTRSVVGLHRDLEGLKHEIERFDTDRDGLLRRNIDDLSKSIQSEEIAVEEFKTRNALLRNSSRILSHLLTKGMQDDPAQDRRVVDRFDGLIKLLMRFADEPRPELAALLRLKFSALMRSPDALSHALSRHGQMILVTRPKVDLAIDGIQRSIVPAFIDQFEQRYLEAYMLASRYANEARLALAAIALVLCVFVAALLRRLRIRSQGLAEQLAFETTANRAKSILGSTAPDDFSQDLKAALNVFSTFFEADEFVLSVLNIQTAEEEELYETRRGDGLRSDGLIARALLHLSRGRPAHSASHAAILTECDDAIGKIAIGSVMREAAAGPIACVLVLSYLDGLPKLTRHKKLLLLSAAGVVMDAIRLNRARSDKVALEQRLEHAKRLEAIGTLAGGVAHEFNNCLGAVLGYGEMLLQSIRRRSKASRYAEEIIGTCHRGLFITDQILSFSRKRERKFLPFDLRHAVRDNIADLKIALPTDCRLELHVGDAPLVVRAHPLEIQQILMNLCKNALEASEADGTCVVTLEKYETAARQSLSHGEIAGGAYAMIGVADAGPGIASHLLDHIFEPFFTTKSLRGGTGLGLAAVHGSVAALSGQINVKTEVGRGTRFDIYLPLVDENPVPLPAFLEDMVVLRGAGEPVAIIDADDERRANWEDHVAAFGYEPAGFANADALLSWAGAVGAPDLVIVDMETCPPDDYRRLQQYLPGTVLLPISEGDTTCGVDKNVCLRPIGARELSQLLHRKLAERTDNLDKEKSETLNR